MRNYLVHGPYPVANEDEFYFVNPDGAPDYDNIANQYGCYIFASKWGAKFTPWYVGKTLGSFSREIFTPHKIKKLTEFRNVRSRGALSVFLISPKRGPGAPSESVVDEIETSLIAWCFRANPQLLNRRKLPRDAWQIVGVTTADRGRPSKGSSALKSMVGLD